MRDGVTVVVYAAGLFYWRLEGWLNPTTRRLRGKQTSVLRFRTIHNDSSLTLKYKAKNLRKMLCLIT